MVLLDGITKWLYNIDNSVVEDVKTIYVTQFDIIFIPFMLFIKKYY